MFETIKIYTMKRIITIFTLFITTIGLSQQIGDGLAAPYLSDFSDFLKSGVYGGYGGTLSKVPDNSADWNHLFVIRHANTANNHQLQIASAFAENDRLFFRKIAGNLSRRDPSWIELATRRENIFTGNQMINGNVGIGTASTDFRLAVNGTIHSKEVKVDMIGWPDYVFKKEYDLQKLSEVEKHIKEKGHLVNIPSEEEVLKNGIQLGEMNAKLLQKIEELTLYLIDQNKSIENLVKENKIQSEEILNLKRKILPN